MDTLLLHGDHATDARGIPVPVYGTEELLQQALLRLGIRRGSFIYDHGLGSELFRLAGDTSAATQRAAASFVQEALIPIPQITVGDVNLIREDGSENLTIRISLTCDDETYLIELKQ
ncbi:MAG: histidine kinase [Oscillospiraceae bacterium]|nr:histidine kinase [Oscillospiraceae bacterium]